jgi:hypothetical protein
MQKRLLNLSLIVTSLLGYLEWGQGQSVFLLQAEFELLKRALSDPLSAVHPFTLMPLFGQVILFVTLFQRTPGKILTYVGIAGIGFLLAFMCLIGLLGPNLKILASTVPFLTLAVVTIRAHRVRPALTGSR